MVAKSCADNQMTTNDQAVVPLLIPGTKPLRSPSQLISHLIAAATGQLVKQLHWLLSKQNQQLGRPFLVGNFAPVHSEVHVASLPLITAEGLLVPAISEAAKETQTKAADAAACDVRDIDAAADQHASGAASGVCCEIITSTVSRVPAEDGQPKLFGASQLPEGLSGAFMRTGPNPLLKPLGGYHWFDGDGMIHCVRIKDGSASYCNRWVPTSRLQQEVAAGWPLFLKMGDHVGLQALALLALKKVKQALGLTDTSQGSGDMPYALRVLCDGLVEAVGRLTVSGPVGNSFTAHPKLDPATGELHFLRYTFDAAPYVSYGVLGPQGDLLAGLDITAANMPRPVMMHDFAITKNWVVFMDHPLTFDGERMVKEKNLPLKFKAEQGSRVGLLPRGAANDSGMLWFQLPSHMVFHVINAWEEEDGTVKLYACHSKSISLNLDTRTTGDIPEDERPQPAVVTVNPNNGTNNARQGSLRIISSVVGDFPTINPAYTGRKNRWSYVATMVTGFGAAVKFDGVAKVDLWAPEGSDALVSKIQLPPGCFSGETVFVARFEDPSKCSAEDDGYLMTYVHDEDSGKSNLVVWDAATMSPEPLAVVSLPQRVPYGFHGLWVTESNFQQQLRSNPLLTKSALPA
eukprot:gene2346-2652_t